MILSEKNSQSVLNFHRNMKITIDSHFQLCQIFEDIIYSSLVNCSKDVFFLAAVSGGADSMAMLAALYQVFTDKPELSINRLSVFHVEHGLRPAEESNGDAEFVRAFCEERKIECSVKHFPPGKIAAYAQRKGIGIEAAARYYRHKALAAKAAKLGDATCILIAHTKDDALELSLMRVLRGCGPSGLAVMPTQKKRENGTVILRPLLSVTRTDVIEYLKAKGITWREDATNAENDFLRNRIRNRLIPLLDKEFPSWRKGLSGMAVTQSLTAEFIAEEARKRIKWDYREISHRGTSNLRFAARRTQRRNNDFEQHLCEVTDSERVNSQSLLSTDAGNFFLQSLIIREEAIFQGINVLVKNAENTRSVKRSVVRKFCCRTVKAADLGAFRVRIEKGNVVLSKVQEEVFESGVSVMIHG